MTMTFAVGAKGEPMSKLIDRNMAITHVYAVLFPNVSAAKKAEKALRQLPAIEENRDEAWEVFSLITSTWYGKECYFIQNDGNVYSRLSGRHMTRVEAVNEFLRRIGDE